MEPIKIAEQTVSLIDRAGVIAAVIISAIVIITGMALAFRSVWLAWMAALAAKQQSDNEHYLQLVATNKEDATLKHDIVDTLKSHTEALKTLSERVAVIADRTCRS